VRSSAASAAEPPDRVNKRRLITVADIKTFMRRTPYDHCASGGAARMRGRCRGVDEKSAIRWGSSGGECDIRATGRNRVGPYRGPDRGGGLGRASIGGFAPSAALRSIMRFNGEAAIGVALFRRLRSGARTCAHRNRIRPHGWAFAAP